MDTINHKLITDKLTNKRWFMNTDQNKALSNVAYYETIRWCNIYRELSWTYLKIVFIGLRCCHDYNTILRVHLGIERF